MITRLQHKVTKSPCIQTITLVCQSLVTKTNEEKTEKGDSFQKLLTFQNSLLLYVSCEQGNSDLRPELNSTKSMMEVGIGWVFTLGWRHGVETETTELG